jgi:hypothetical protein
VGIQQRVAEMSAFDAYLAAPAQGAAPSFDAYLGTAPSVPASAAGGAGVPVVQAAAGQPPQASGAAQDMAMGGSSPDALNDMGSILSGGAHGIGSMFNNAANFVERQAGKIGIFPETAAHDTAIQAAADQQFSQNASPGAQASAIVAPMLLPMSGAMKAGDAVKAGVTALPRMGGTLGRVIGSTLGNATNGAILSTGAPIDPNQPAGPQDAQHLEAGAVLGAALPAAFNVARAAGTSAYNVARPVLNPRAYVGEQLAGQLGDQAGDTAANIRNAPTFVPGSMPTTAQVGQNPVLVATEKAAANANPDFKIALANRAISNNDARWQTLMGVAQTPEALKAAQDARGAAATPLYNAAHEATANVGPAFMRYAQIPEMQEAMQRADDLASLTAATRGGVAPVWPTPQSKVINGAALDYTSRALGDMIGEAQRAGSDTRAGALAALKNNVDSWTQTYIPGVKQADAAYAAGSIPVNTMEVGQQIANGLGTRAMNAGGAPEIQMMPFRSALTQAMGSGNAAKYGIDADALNSLQGVGQDLQRATVSNGLKSPGSDTAYNVSANGWLARNLYGPNFEGASGLGKTVAALGTAAAGHPIAAGGLLLGGNRIGQMVGGRLNEHLGNLLLNPSDLLPYLDARAAGPVNATQQALRAALARQILPAAVGGVARGGLINSP